MKGASMIMMVLLIVLAIPLFSVSVERNSEIKLSAISTLNEEVSFSDQELFDSNVPVLAVGLKKSYLLDTNNGRLYANADIGIGSKKYNTKSTIHGGVKRTNLRKH